MDSVCRDGSDAEPRQRKRHKSATKEPSVSPGDQEPAIHRSEGGDTTTAPSSIVPFTLACAAQAAGVWNRSTARPTLPKMLTMMSATEAHTPRHPGDIEHVTLFEGCESGAVVKDSVEHADALHRESGADPVSQDQQQQYADVAAFLNESSTRTIPSDALQKLLQQCAAGGQLSISDLVRAVCILSSPIYLLSA